MSPPDVLYAERALAVEPREPPPVGVTRGYCRTSRAGGGNRKACGGLPRGSLTHQEASSSSGQGHRDGERIRRLYAALFLP